jgi:hypothetical protein
MSKKFDQATARKLIGEYADKINYYIKENSGLQNQLEDTKISLNLNKELMFKTISNTFKADTIFNELKDENIRLTLLVQKLHEEKASLDKKVRCNALPL